MLFIWHYLEKTGLNGLKNMSKKVNRNKKNIVSRIIRRIKMLYFDKAIKDFIEHNKSVWGASRVHNSESEIILCDSMSVRATLSRL